MKKLFTILVLGLMLAVSACGPTAKQMEDQRVADSVRVADSCTLVCANEQRVADSLTKMKADSLKADSLLKAKAPKVMKVKK